jgi:hypothetical protein
VVVLGGCCSGGVLFWRGAVLAGCCSGGVLFWRGAVLAGCCSGGVLFWRGAGGLNETATATDLPIHRSTDPPIHRSTDPPIHRSDPPMICVQLDESGDGGVVDQRADGWVLDQCAVLVCVFNPSCPKTERDSGPAPSLCSSLSSIKALSKLNQSSIKAPPCCRSSQCSHASLLPASQWCAATPLFYQPPSGVPPSLSSTSLPVVWV